MLIRVVCTAFFVAVKGVSALSLAESTGRPWFVMQNLKEAYANVEVALFYGRRASCGLSGADCSPMEWIISRSVPEKTR